MAAASAGKSAAKAIPPSTSRQTAAPIPTTKARNDIFEMFKNVSNLILYWYYQDYCPIIAPYARTLIFNNLTSLLSVYVKTFMLLLPVFKVLFVHVVNYWHFIG